MVEGLVTRAARVDELEALVDIERRASARFEDVPGLEHFSGTDLTPLRELARAHADGLVWTADLAGAPRVGWCYAVRVDDSLFLEQLDVLPEHGRRGIGAALVASVAERARNDGLASVTLTTDRIVPWNRPWYEKLGFVVVAPTEQSAGLAAKVADEARRGLPVERRVALRLTVDREPRPSAGERGSSSSR